LILGGFLLVGAFVLFAFPSLKGKPKSAPQVIGTEMPTYLIQRVSAEDAKAALDNQEAIFIDVRDPGVYSTSHIKGALSIPLQNLTNRIGELDQKAWIITY
jgi:3-mercaptopyruvate sulfurtransferase SseA